MSSRTQPEQQQKFAMLEQRARDFQQKYEEIIESFAVASLPLQRQAFECCVHCFDSCGGGNGEQRHQTKQSSSGGGWSRFFKAPVSGEASAADSSSFSGSATPTADSERRGGEKIHEQITRCISGCHTKGEHVSRAVQQELDVLQSTLESCQKVCYSRLADDSQRQSTNHPAAGAPPFTDKAEKCFVQCFSDAEPLLKEISSRIHKRIKDNI